MWRSLNYKWRLCRTSLAVLVPLGGGFVLFFFRVLTIISRVSFTGTLVYRLVISREARANWGRIGVSSSFLIRSLVFSTS